MRCPENPEGLIFPKMVLLLQCMLLWVTTVEGLHVASSTLDADENQCQEKAGSAETSHGKVDIPAETSRHGLKVAAEVPSQQKVVVEFIGNVDSESSTESNGSSEIYKPSEAELGSSNSDEDLSNADEELGILQENNEMKRKRKGQVNKSDWKIQKNKRLRLNGKAYVGFRKDEISGKYKQDSLKSSRNLLNRCEGHPPRNTPGGPRQNFQCATINEEQRKVLFSSFWELPSWDAKKVYLRENALTKCPKYRKVTNEESRKNVTFSYFLTINEDCNNRVKKQVCKQMFLNTLCLGAKTLRTWVLNIDKPRVDCVANRENVENVRSSIVGNLEEFLYSLPKVESHYCRASSSKLYLEPTWVSFREMDRYYIEKCEAENKRSASWATFQKVIKKLNLDIYTPKKDQCNECIMYKIGTLNEEAYQLHIKKKNDARTEKDKDKTVAIKCQEIQSYTVDLQAVLLAPRLNASANYYKTKLKVHNLTYFNLSTKDVVCYVWHEANGGLESDVFASIATMFFSKELEEKKPTKIIIWSDGCGYQNRNVKLANALLELSNKYNVTIEQKYLEVGHTQMEVDSIHASIEKKLGKRKEVYVPADYLTIIQTARQNPKPYLTVYLEHKDFLKFDTVYYTSIRPGKKVGDSCVNDVVGYQYGDGVIKYKISFENDWEELPRRPMRAVNIEHPKLYKGPCPIESSKFGHLQELKQLIPKDYHSFYNSLISK